MAAETFTYTEEMFEIASLSDDLGRLAREIEAKRECVSQMLCRLGPSAAEEPDRHESYWAPFYDEHERREAEMGGAIAAGSGAHHLRLVVGESPGDPDA